jgi:hypothetical protein
MLVCGLNMFKFKLQLKVVRLSLKTNFSRLGRVEALGRLVAYHNN